MPSISQNSLMKMKFDSMSNINFKSIQECKNRNLKFMPFTDLKYFDIRFIFILHSVIGNLIQKSDIIKWIILRFILIPLISFFNPLNASAALI